MAEQTGIAWTQHTFNPWIGCTKVSLGCDHCYAEVDRPSRALGVRWGRGQPRHRTAPVTWAQPLAWDRAATAEGRRHRVFCASLADVFDAEVDPTWRADLWALIRATPHLDWQLLTKRPNLIARSLPPDWGAGWPHVWLGTSVERQDYIWRIDHLRRVPAAVRFLSCEPLLGPLALDLTGMQWLIAGGESGAQRRPLDRAWVRGLRDQCQATGVAFFFKQGSSYQSGQDCLLDGQEHKAFPTTDSGLVVQMPAGLGLFWLK
jgi:protein gp37